MEELIIDLELGAKLVGNLTVAKELLAMLIKDLPLELELIKRTIAQGNFSETLDHLHKLRGALSYCGVPRLRSAAFKLENALRFSGSLVNLASIQFQTEVNLLIANLSAV